VEDVTLQPGQHRTLAVRIDRSQCQGPVKLRLEDLLAGVHAKPGLIGAEDSVGQIELQAAPTATEGAQQAQLVAVAGAARARRELRVTVQGPPTEIVNLIDMTLVLIPAGKLKMGSPKGEEGRFGNEELHEVEITRSFYLGKHEVTRGQFRHFVVAEKYKTEAERDGKGGWGLTKDGTWKQAAQFNWKNTGWSQDDNHPVVNVTWNDAKAFCDWLHASEGKQYRLPTEAEWEYSCRAGTTTRFHNGDDPEALAQVGNAADASARKRFSSWTMALKADDGYVFTAPVGKLRANLFGLHDMHGNVGEWCYDWYKSDYYKDSPGQDPRGPADGRARVVRGGSFSDGPRECRAACRSYQAPRYRSYNLGFRVALVP
jgi:formylglycine-generating enzyme required for sulfatase activity